MQGPLGSWSANRDECVQVTRLSAVRRGLGASVMEVIKWRKSRDNPSLVAQREHWRFESSSTHFHVLISSERCGQVPAGRASEHWTTNVQLNPNLVLALLRSRNLTPWISFSLLRVRGVAQVVWRIKNPKSTDHDLMYVITWGATRECSSST